MIQSSRGGKNGKFNETIEVSALWSISTVPNSKCPTEGWSTYGEVCLIGQIFECTTPHLVYGKEHI